MGHQTRSHVKDHEEGGGDAGDEVSAGILGVAWPLPQGAEKSPDPLQTAALRKSLVLFDPVPDTELQVSLGNKIIFFVLADSSWLVLDRLAMLDCCHGNQSCDKRSVVFSPISFSQGREIGWRLNWCNSSCQHCGTPVALQRERGLKSV